MVDRRQRVGTGMGQQPQRRRPVQNRTNDSQQPRCNQKTGESSSSGTREPRNAWEAYCSKLTEKKIMERGLQFANRKNININKVKPDKNMKKFRSYYGVGPKAIMALIKDLPPREKFCLYDLFMALSFANTYNSEEVHAANWGVCPDKLKDRVKFYFKQIQSLKNKKIRIGKFKKGTIYGYSVDGVHCRTRENRKNPTKSVYSHKFQGPGIAYEVGLAIHENRALWTKGPFVASTHDGTMFKKKNSGAFHPDMPQGKKGIADSIYSSLNENLTVHREGHSKEMTNFINRVRARHESFYNRIKVFEILSNTFRGSWEKREIHKMFFESCVVLVQYDMENGHPLMET